eukprot:1157839-Pelagomonas_calceolata.AAC.5
MERPYLQQASVQVAYDFLLQHNNNLFSFLSKLMDIMLAGEDQSWPISQAVWLKVPPYKFVNHVASSLVAALGCLTLHEARMMHNPTFVLR